MQAEKPKLSKKSPWKRKRSYEFAPCPYCRSTTVYRNGHAWGRVRQVFASDGTLLETDASALNHSTSTVIRCTGCDRVRKDLTTIQTTIGRNDQRIQQSYIVEKVGR